MNGALKKNKWLIICALLLPIVTATGLGLQGCQPVKQAGSETTNGQVVDSESTPIPRSTSGDEIHSQITLTPTRTLAEVPQAIWQEFAPPSIDPATPIPPPMSEMELSDEILVWVLLGSDAEPPFTGRTQAIHLLFIHPRFSKASLVSLPGDLFVYIPGYTMQRLNTAYTLGGIETLRSTLLYNFGVAPSRFVLAHPGDFQWLVDDINGINVTVFFPMLDACGGLRPGEIRMDGTTALCYASYRDGIDEFDRMRRQQQLLQSIFKKFTSDGNLIRLPVLYASYEGWVKTDLSLPELIGYIPLALRLADQGRITYYMIGWDHVQLWDVPGHSQAQVFLPLAEGVNGVLRNAINDVMTPGALTGQVQTLEAQLTAAYLATASPVAPTSTMTATSTMTFTSTPTPTITTSQTIPPSPTTTSSPEVTFTSTITGTVTDITTSPSPSPTPTLTPPGYP